MTAFAHSGGEHAAAVWTVWNWSPWVIVSLFTLALLYARGWSNMRKHKSSATLRFYRWQPWAFGGGMVTLFVALLSPVSHVSELLGSVHMVQHMLIMMVAAPLFAFGAPGMVTLWAAPPGSRRALWRIKKQLMRWRLPLRGLAHPILVTLIYGAVLWTWHLPVFYEAALRAPWLHDLQHISFFAAACFFWRSLYDPFDRGLNVYVGLMYLFVASLHSMALGVFMALSPNVWYAHYARVTKGLGIDPLVDQQTAGYIMWMPVGIIYVVAAVAVLLHWLKKYGEDPIDSRRALE